MKQNRLITLCILSALTLTAGMFVWQRMETAGMARALASNPSWSLTPNLAATHHGTRGTVLLPNGKVLVVGGDYPLSTAELYDPTTGTWSPAGTLASVRFGHTVTLLANGKVLVVGGVADGNSYTPVPTNEIYDPATGTWSLAAASNFPRSQHTATLLPNGKVLIAGGIADGFNVFTAELYDPATGAWSTTGNLNHSRRDFTATLLPNGKVLVVCGGGSFSYVSSAELYDPATGAWSFTGDTGKSRVSFSATLLADGRVLIAGGHEDFSFAPLTRSDIYDPATGLWSQTGNLNNVHSQHPATLLPDGKVLLTGGYPSYNSVEIFDPATGTWSPTASLLVNVTYHSNTLLPSGKVLVVAYNTGQLYDSGVGPASTSTALASNLNPSAFGDAVTFTATVSSTGAVNQGTVTFKEGATILAGPVTLNASAQASFNTSSLSAGSHTITAEYSGSTNFAPSSDSVVQSVNKADQTISFDVLAGKTFGDAPFTVAATASSGLPVSFSIISGPATISGNTATITGAGTVIIGASQAGDSSYNAAPAVEQSFAVNKATPLITWSNPTDIIFGTALNGAQLNATANVAGSFSYNPPAATVLNAGNGQILSATFTPSDTANYNSATASRSINVNRAVTAIVVGSSLNPSVAGQMVTFTATVTSAGGVPGGTVEFKDGVNSIGVLGVSSGSAALTTSALSAGSHSITAVYSGNANFLGGVSPVLTQTVAAPSPTGSNVAVQSTVGSTTITTTFSNVTAGGTTTVTPIDPSSAGTLPGGFNLSGASLAFEIETTAQFNGAANVCFQVPSVTSAAEFANLRVLHTVGKQDLVVANYNSNNLSVLLGNGSGGFGSAASIAAGTRPRSVAVGDFNNDDKQDLAIANEGTNNLLILSGNGMGGFSLATNYSLGAGAAPAGVAVGDFNADGKPDFAVAKSGSNSVAVLLGNGAGGISGSSNITATLGRPLAVAVGDFNADGKQDLAVANWGGLSAAVMLGNGAGGFGTAANFAVGDNPHSLAVGDFNGDGKQDLMVLNSNSINSLMGNGAGGFVSLGRFSTGVGAFSIAAGDFNADGRQDVVTAARDASQVTIHLGNGAGRFSSVTGLAIAGGPMSVAVGDFNADGRQDVVTANWSNSVSLLLGNGAGGFSAPVNFSAGTGPFSIAVGNFNRDTTVVDQTILSGPNAPHFASKTICARVLSFSPFIITNTVDQTPPQITGVSASPSVLWPPNGKLVGVTVNYNATDNYTSASDIRCTLSVTSDEPANGFLDGNTNVDWEVVDAHHVRLRAERALLGNGRVYTINITCTDAAQNSSSKTVTVKVPTIWDILLGN